MFFGARYVYVCLTFVGERGLAYPLALIWVYTKVADSHDFKS